MNRTRICRGLLLAALIGASTVRAQSPRLADVDSPRQVRQAIAYLDSRQEDWSKFASSGRGQGEDRTTCLSCHTGISYALTRPALGRFVDAPAPSATEERTVAEVTRRVEHWADLDLPRFRLMYDFDERKKVESRGTEAVLNALILARADLLRGKAGPVATSRSALTHLWETQETKGDDAGSWAWLQFGLEPWEGGGSRAFGAALAAIAVGSSPGYLDGPLDERATRGVAMLREYLRRRFARESLHNRLWILEASTSFQDLITPEQQREILDQVRAAQREDGGWALASLGQFRRVDGSSQPSDSEGYATGLALHALIGSGVPTSQPELAKGIGWLRTHQRPDGSWPGISLNKERDPSTFTGKLMIDAATAFAARALVEAGSK